MRIFRGLPARIGVLFVSTGIAAPALAQSLCGAYPPGGGSYSSAVVLTCDTTLSTGSFDFQSTVDGGYHLSIQSASSVAFVGKVGSATPLAGLAVASTTFTALDSMWVNGNLSIDANNGIAQMGSFTVQGTSNFVGHSAPVVLTDASNDFAGPVSLTGGSTQITDRNALTLGTLATGALTVTSMGALNLGSGAIGGALQATSNNGAISQMGALSVSGVSTFNAGVGAITLTNAGNDFAAEVRLAGGNAQIMNSQPLTLGASNLGGILNVDAAGGITLVGNVMASGAQNYGDAVSLGGSIVLSGTTVSVTHGLNTGSAALLSVNGDVAVGGVLSFAFASTPSAGQSVTVVSATGTRSGTFSGVNVSGLAPGQFVTASYTATGVQLIVGQPQLALSIDKGHAFARYGQVVEYIVTASNTGDVANAVPVTFTLSSGFDGAYANLTCFGAGAGASCEQDASNPLRFTLTLPTDRSVTWRIDVPVLSDTGSETSLEFGVSADGATPVTDTATLVIFRDGFDTPYGDGTRSPLILEGAQARAILDGEALYEFAVPAMPSEKTTLLVARDATREVRVEGDSAVGVPLVHMIERRANGEERATAWSQTRAGATLTLGSVAAMDEPAGVDKTVLPRAIVLLGAQAPLTLH